MLKTTYLSRLYGDDLMTLSSWIIYYFVAAGHWSDHKDDFVVVYFEKFQFKANEMNTLFVEFP